MSNPPCDAARMKQPLNILDPELELIAGDLTAEERLELADAFARLIDDLESGKIMPFYALPESDLLKLPPSEAPLSWN